jgi:hypothetical protein
MTRRERKPTPHERRLATLPLVGNMRVPVVSLVVDGTHLLGWTSGVRDFDCMTQNLCSVCGESMQGDWPSYVIEQANISELATYEAGMHVECLRYSQSVCPHLLDVQNLAVAVLCRRPASFTISTSGRNLLVIHPEEIVSASREDPSLGTTALALQEPTAPPLPRSGDPALPGDPVASRLRDRLVQAELAELIAIRAGVASGETARDAVRRLRRPSIRQPT